MESKPHDNNGAQEFTKRSAIYKTNVQPGSATCILNLVVGNLHHSGLWSHTNGVYLSKQIIKRQNTKVILILVRST